MRIGLSYVIVLIQLTTVARFVTHISTLGFSFEALVDDDESVEIAFVVALCFPQVLWAGVREQLADKGRYVVIGSLRHTRQHHADEPRRKDASTRFRCTRPRLWHDSASQILFIDVRAIRRER